MANKLELDLKRIQDYQKIKNNILSSIKNQIDNELETSFSKKDFNDILDENNTETI